MRSLTLFDFGAKRFKGKGKVRLQENTFEDFVEKEIKKEPRS